MFLFFEVLADLTVRFLDAHAHIIENGFMMELPLAGSKSVQGDVQPITLQNLTYLITKYCSDVVERVKAYILSHPDVHNDTTQWIEGWGWDQTKWSKAQFPIAVRLDFTTVQTISSCQGYQADLDQDPLLKGRLISLSRIDGHARWVSPAVLQQMPDLPEKVDGGLIVRNEQGNPTGIFVDNAANLIPTPEWSQETISRFYELTIKEALSYGLTSIHDADTKVNQIKFFKK